ncbi:MAG: hypothetical protein H0V27_14520 [Pyrinomonadaceae bacterium]|nr:hypothetical protein [Pyrinomonadaceae bacterium]
MNIELEEQESDAMRRRKITLPDGRYLIFYDFGEAQEPQTPSVEIKPAAPEPPAEAKQSAEDERSV